MDSEFHCWATPKCRHVHDDPFQRRDFLILYVLLEVSCLIFGLMFFSLAYSQRGLYLVDQYTEINISISPTLTSVIGFVVALSISFRNQTAYERFTEGRRLWNQLQVVIRNMGRIIWLQVGPLFLNSC